MTFYGLLSLIFLNLVYLLGFLFTSIITNVKSQHYFLGFGSKIVSFNIQNTKISIGIYIPIVFLSRIYTVEEDQKQRMTYPWEFFDQPVFKRFAATLGGVLSLLLFSILILIITTYNEPEYHITKEEVNKSGIYPSEVAIKYGFQRGDKVLTINGKDYNDYYDLIDLNVLKSPGCYVTVLRNGKEIKISLDGISDEDLYRPEPFLMLLVPFEITEVEKDSPAEYAGIKPGDQIISVNEQSIIKINDLRKELASDSDGVAKLMIKRRAGGNIDTISTVVSLSETHRLGIFHSEIINYTIDRRSLIDAIGIGTVKALSFPVQNVKALLKLMSGEIYTKKLSAPIGVSKIYDSQPFWIPTVYLALNAIFWNFFPFPKSVFWELIPLVYERLSNKKYSYRVFKKTLVFSWVSIALFFGWIILNDIIRLFSM